MRLPDCLTDLADLVLPRECAGCRCPAALLCQDCRAVLRSPTVGGSLLGLTAPDPRPRDFPVTVAGAPYGGVVQSALLAHKERGRLALVHPLGALLGEAVRAVPGANIRAGPVSGVRVTVVPVPSARAAVRARGHDHALRLARVAAAHVGLAAEPLLVPARRLADQAGLSATARSANLRGALVARRALRGVPVVVVDDVVTTGATLVEAVRALQAAGADVRGAAVVAATQRHG